MAASAAGNPDDEMTNFFITGFSGVGAGALQMTYAYKKSEHNDVAHSLFGNFEMDSSVNNGLRKAVIRLAARARPGRNPDWFGRLRRMSREKVFLAWHSKTRPGIFDMKKEIVEYYQMDVEILRRACIQFRKIFLDVADTDPFV